MKVVSVKPVITYKDLDKIDIRVGTIEEVIDIEKSDKLVKLIVNFGDQIDASGLVTRCKRQIVVGLKKERENPKEIEGKQALFVVNLEPKEMMWVKSEGMLFDIGHADGITPVLAVPERLVPDGTRAG
ncbi:tRNA-binding protein [Candidatus Woesebacteria bacterium RIFCSPHIGHO2_01_FULL_39_32]|uniref:tRNA-binding protein n=1 Tax=Candidatus Woesebacteria bacterium RIFCSPLOWO2_01_FULL_39_25 TaxID=1802521 RepID=A0A1F8BK20_9BACT|nr:MAG: tRNA-binding protein [Candidatus Woesebacteria bacterium GWB1_37_5]OGM24074.1 MAG: tRNA-binding protein [Candidatus Woesebacteria bacterium RIFCSPHIGHO2_01_FULL_39_32]OGM37947.1 MAG: tRNA-binding protein [Candidatus Woesebacteria bacterium RIFCSPHIGHO2_12_FULL_38_11]OGM64417.1 MAG: tRNA-binding protein [Candidatus Woesebacteria bacterium RIFCSPLOWO2_01_FULL_39_25]